MAPAQRLICLITTTALLLTFTGSKTLAQSLNQVAYYLTITDSQAATGMIVSQDNNQFQLSNQDYDAGIYGVIDLEAAVVLGKITNESKPVVISGETKVRVSKVNGDISKGDLITTSKDKGIGQKATRSGHILGKALADFPSSSNDSPTGLIPVLISVNYNQISSQSEGLTDQGIDQVAKKVSSSLVSGNLPDLLKYVFALVLGAISFLVGLSHFVKSNRTAVEAIARNPLAKTDIQRQLVFGTAGILVVCALGLGISVWILLYL